MSGFWPPLLFFDFIIFFFVLFSLGHNARQATAANYRPSKRTVVVGFVAVECSLCTGRF